MTLGAALPWCARGSLFRIGQIILEGRKTDELRERRVPRSRIWVSAIAQNALTCPLWVFQLPWDSGGAVGPYLRVTVEERRVGVTHDPLPSVMDHGLILVRAILNLVLLME